MYFQVLNYNAQLSCENMQNIQMQIFTIGFFLFHYVLPL